ncbi:MAG: hypothetical protein KDB27_01675 [Planctomycetales bacterium]|nr:hypothetical protein [Planctomycetales bacterium]
MRSVFVLTVGFSVILGNVAQAQRAAMAREAAEFVMRKFGRKAVSESVEQLARKGELLAAKYGDEAFAALKKVGPRTFQLADDAGEFGGKAVQLMAKHGDEAIWVARNPNRLKLVAAHGDDAALAMIRHGQIAEPLIVNFGDDAARAISKLSGQNARRLAMMGDDGGLNSELVSVVGQYGDKAMDFIWKNKGALATVAVAATFVANPEPYIDGTLSLTEQVLDKAVEPMAGVASQVAADVVPRTNWTLLGCITIVVIGLLRFGKSWLRQLATSRVG